MKRPTLGQLAPDSVTAARVSRDVRGPHCGHAKPKTKLRCIKSAESLSRGPFPARLCRVTVAMADVEEGLPRHVAAARFPSRPLLAGRPLILAVPVELGLCFSSAELRIQFRQRWPRPSRPDAF